MQSDIEKCVIRVYGIVQGVGFRPTVVRYAGSEGVTGTVMNCGAYVEIYAEGTRTDIKRFLELIKNKPPKRAVILKMDVKEIDGNTDEDGSCDERIFHDFRITESKKDSGEIFISPDIAVCDECKKELFDPSDRRYMHPFINCTSCGPRLTILEALPYDRKRTSMKKFQMCPECASEYRDKKSRRYDAQPVCCNECGPKVFILGNETCEGRDAIEFARKTIIEGGIVAIKGIGGFHLACDASNKNAVKRLRELKHRPSKPFAVMMRDEETVKRECIFSDEQEKILTGHQKPILLLERKRTAGIYGAQKSVGMICTSDDISEKSKEKSRLADEIAPGCPMVGVMLSYAPVQLLLFGISSEKDSSSMTDMLVMTSGNDSGAPIVKDDTDAVRELSDKCDCILTNNRDIRIRTDDSVMDFYNDEPYMIRRSRGYAPVPIMLDIKDDFSDYNVKCLKNTDSSDDICAAKILNVKTHKVLAVGGELKNTFCLSNENLYYPSSYVGDLSDVRSAAALRDGICKMQQLLEINPDIVVCDMHPLYQSVKIAENIAASRKIPLVRVQHHFAHVVSCMAENNCPNPVIGVAFDGTGYGSDGTIWGGEFLISDYHDFKRVASIFPFKLTGGDNASKEGWRVAVSMIYGAEAEIIKMAGDCENDSENTAYQIENKAVRIKNNAAEIIAALKLVSPETEKVQRIMYDSNMNSVKSTSVGRLFDAVAAILGICRKSTFEGEASTALMYRAMEYEKKLKSEVDTKQDILHELMSELREAMKKSEICESAVPEHAISEKTVQNLETGLYVCTDNNFDVLRTDILFALIVKYAVIIDGGNCRYDIGSLSFFFHYALAEMTAFEICNICKKTGIKIAALTGGVYQNKLMLKLTEEKINEYCQDIKVIRHHYVPANDGGIALGQAVIGRYMSK